MKIRFNGGPWDGVEFDSPICFDAIGGRKLHFDTQFLGKDKDDPYHVEMSRRDHHQYIYDGPKVQEGIELIVGVNLQREPEQGDFLPDLVDSEFVVHHYKYAPGKKSDFETEEKGCLPFFPAESAKP